MPVICPTAQVFFSSAARVQNSLVHGYPASMSRKREPAKNVVGDVIEEDEPQRQPATGVEPQVTAVCVAMKSSKVDGARLMIDHASSACIHPAFILRRSHVKRSGLSFVSASKAPGKHRTGALLA
jgi:hypothetical protein